MKLPLVLGASMLASFFHYADAAPPSWCSTTFEVGDYELRELQRKNDPDQAMVAIAKATCSTSALAEAHRAELDAARAAWSKKYGMADSDWSEVVAYAQDSNGSFFHGALSTTDVAKLTPVDQYRLVAKTWNDSADPDPLYYADIFEGSLSEAGRVALVDWCLEPSLHGAADDATKWAVCQDDIEKLDLPRLFAELHGDPHDGSSKFIVRLRAVALAGQIRAYNAARAKLVAQDPTYGKMFETAATARTEWARVVGTNRNLLELTTQMDAAVGFHSRKLFEGCEARTAEALAAAVARIPAKQFAGMNDVRDDPYGGFARKARDVLARDPVVTVAAIAVAECQPHTGLGKYAAYVLDGIPTSRGPRSHALAALMGAGFQFDDTTKPRLSFPSIRSRPYPYGGEVGSAGGVVKHVQAGDKGPVNVALEKLTIVQDDCVKSHETGRITRLRPDGKVEYESVCDQVKAVAHDRTWENFSIEAESAKRLAPGVLFSATYGTKGGAEVLATWANKRAKLPSTVLGAAVK